jgi:molybdopterin synthase catalytic subunit
MDAGQIVDEIRKRPDAGRIGMILTHIGLVRETSRDGRPVSGLSVSVDHDQLGRILATERQSPGIFDIRIDIVEDQPLSVGDEIMRLVVAGDIRENVIPALERTLSAVKKTVTRKTEFYEAPRQGG